LASKILCERHNSVVLSPLDTVAKRLFCRLHRIRQNLTSNGKAGDQLFLFNGHDIERFMLKMLCGQLFSGNTSVGGRRIGPWKPPLGWLGLLVGFDPFPAGAGLYVDAHIGQASTLLHDVQMGPLIDGADSDRYLGLILSLAGCGFVLLVEPPDSGAKVEWLTNKLYRPAELVFTNGTSRNTIWLVWDGPSSNGSVTFTYESRPSEAENATPSVIERWASQLKEPINEQDAERPTE
jgi:hypothetical protein